MQLKTVGESLNALKVIKSIVNNTSLLGLEQNIKLANSLKGYSTEAIKAAIAQSTLNETQIRAILVEKGLTGQALETTTAELAQTITTNALTASQTGATASTLGLGTAIKGLGASMKAFALSNPILTAIAAIGVTIYGAVKAYDELILSVEKANEATKEAIDSLDSLSSEVENLENKISDLNEQIGKLDQITDAEDLENLKAETAELETQLAILKEKQRIAGSDADKAAQESLGMTQASKYKIEERESAYGGVEVGAAYVTKDEELLNAMEAYDEYKLKVDEANRALADMAETGEYTQNQWNEQEQIISKYSKKMDDARSHANELADTLIEQKQGLNGSTEASQKLLNTIDSTISGYNEWLNVINGTTNALEEQEQIEKKVSDEITASLSITETIDQLNTQLKPAFDSIQSAWEDIFTDDGFTLENVDLSMLDSIKDSVDEINKVEGISIDYSAFETLTKILTDTASTESDVKNGFNDFITEIVYGTGALNNLNSSNAQLVETMLESLGVTNAHEIVYDSLIAKTETLALKEQLLSEIGTDLTSATSDKVLAFLNQAGASEVAKNYLIQLIAEEQVFSNQDLDVSGKIYKLQELAQAYGQTALAAKIAAQEKANEESHTVGSWSETDLQNFQKEWNEGLSSVTVDWSGINNKSSKSGSKSSSSEKDLWLEEYKRKLEELKRQLNEELISQKDFYYQSEALMNAYLKNTPAHLAKYAEEIADAENTLHDEWIKTFEYEKSELDKNVSDNVLVQWQYYEQLSELAGKYYNSLGASYGKFADEYDEITQEIKEGQKKLWEDVFDELNSQLDSLQSACGTVKDAIGEYSENQSLSLDTVQKLVDLEPQYLAMLLDENGQLQLNEEAYAKLAQAKLEEMKVDLAYQALNTINGLESEAQAVELLTGKYAELRDTSLGAVEAMLQVAVAEAHNRGEKQGQAADMMMEVYQNQKKVIDMADFSIPSLTGKEEKEEKQFLKTFDWIGTLLEKISEKTSKLVDKVDKFYNWQKKNSMINRAVKSTDREISQNERAYQAYMKKANSTGLGLNYVRKIQNGTLSIEDITNESLSNKIDEYQEWYDKAQDCLNTIEDLYDQQRDLIRQKLDNVLDYYSDMDSYLSSITSKIESIISLNDKMGKRSSLTELVEQFASMSDQLEAVTTKNVAGVTITEGSLGDSEKVAEAVNRDRQELADAIQAEIDNLDVKESGTYTKLLDSIAKTKAQVDKYEDKGWDKSKAKSYENLQKKLRNYYDLQKALDENATSNTIANYEKTYTAYQRLQNKIDSGKTLSKSEQKSYDLYSKQLEDLKAQGQSALDELYAELAEAEGTAQKQTEADRIQGEIEGIRTDLENTATYQNLLKSIETTENKIAALDKKGYNNLTSGQKKTYDKLKVQLEDYYDQKESLDENATAANIAEYNKIYLAWKKLQDKLDGGGNLSESQWKKYDSYMQQLENFADEKADIISKLNESLEEALNPSDKLGQIQKTYEESAKGIYDSYQNQIDSINGESENTKQYQNLLAKAQKLEQKKDTKGLSKSEQAKLDKYNAELDALQKGATGNNITDYIKTWESWYRLRQKLDNGKKLSANEAQKYDTYKAQLEAWNNEKQSQINDLLSLMEDDLEQLQKTYTENVSEAESEVNDYYANLYALAKQIAEYNLTTLQAQLEYLDAYISYYKELVSLYDTFSGDRLTKLLTDLDENVLADKADVYQKYLDTLQDKYNTTLSEMNEYGQLLDALDTNDFESSMDLFDKALESYKAGGDTVMADKLQSVLDLLNERAVDADNWGEFADQWAEEWEKEFAAAKQELIGTATEIQNVNDALRQIKLDNISDIINGLDTAKGILSSIADLIQEDWMYDDGELSEYGRAKVALLVSQLEDSQKKANAYLDLINEIQNNKDTYASDKAYMEDLNNATQDYYNTLGETASLENSIVELMKKSAEEEINSLKSIIDARKKALQKKKEYYDYDKNLKNSQKEIDSIKAQIAAIENLSGTMDAATKAKLAQLKADLAEKEESLQETKDDHTYNLQIDALDEFTASLEDMLNSSTQSLEEIINSYKDAINDATEIYKTSTDSVNDTISKLTAFYKGTGVTNDMIDVTPGETVSDNEDVSGNPVETLTDSTSPENGFINLTELLDELNAKGMLLTPEHLQTLSVSDQPLFNLANTHMPQITDAIQRIPTPVRNDVQPVINVHYDNMINVEGSVDKSFSKELEHDADKIYNGVVNKLAGDFRQRGIIPHRTTLPTVR